MQEYSLGYVPNLSARISSVRSSDVVCTIVYTIPVGTKICVDFSARYTNYSWYKLVFDFSTRLQINKLGYTYKGFRVDNWSEWSGDYHTYLRSDIRYVSEASFRMEYMPGTIHQAYVARTFYVFYETDPLTMNLLEINDFEQIEI